MKTMLIIGLYLFLVSCKNDKTNSVQQTEKIKKTQDIISKQDTEKEDIYDTIRYNYTGRVGKLPINCTLLFLKSKNEEGFKNEFYGSYYYTTYKPNEIYELKGNFTVLGCIMPNDSENKRKEFEGFSPNMIEIQEYTNQKITADISLCYKTKVSYMKGQMHNTNGQVFEMFLEKE